MKGSFIFPISLFQVWIPSPFTYLRIFILNRPIFFLSSYSHFPLVEAYLIINNKEMILKLSFYLYTQTGICRFFLIFCLPISEIFLCLKPDALFFFFFPICCSLFGQLSPLSTASPLTHNLLTPESLTLSSEVLRYIYIYSIYNTIYIVYIYTMFY